MPLDVGNCPIRRHGSLRLGRVRVLWPLSGLCGRYCHDTVAARATREVSPICSLRFGLAFYVQMKYWRLLPLYHGDCTIPRRRSPVSGARWSCARFSVDDTGPPVGTGKARCVK